jgi:hypothetical protein
VEGGAAERSNSTQAHGYTWNIKEIREKENQFTPCVYVNTVAVFVYAASVDIALLARPQSPKTIVIIPTW